MKKEAIDFTFLYKKYPGRWVALDNDEKSVLGTGKTAREAIRESKKNGGDCPILHRVPSKISLSISLILP